MSDHHTPAGREGAKDEPDPAPAPLFEMLDLEAAADEAEPDAAIQRAGYVVTVTVADDVAVDIGALAEAALAVLVEEEAPAGQLDLHLVDRETIRELNDTHMQSNEPTDVLAFPLEPDELDVTSAGDRPALLGDVVLCPSVAFAQAPGHTGSFESEMLLLTIHGTLHVLGHDHGETAERLLMQGRERHFLAQYDVAHPVPAP